MKYGELFKKGALSQETFDNSGIAKNYLDIFNNQVDSYTFYKLMINGLKFFKGHPSYSKGFMSNISKINTHFTSNKCDTRSSQFLTIILPSKLQKWTKPSKLLITIYDLFLFKRVPQPKIKLTWCPSSAIILYVLSKQSQWE